VETSVSPAQRIFPQAGGEGMLPRSAVLMSRRSSRADSALRCARLRGPRRSAPSSARPWWLLVTAFGCGHDETTAAVTSATVAPSASEAPPEPPPAESSAPVVMPEPRCRPDMVKVKPHGVRAYCVDRYESMLVDRDNGERISPHYAPSRRRASYCAKLWEKERFEVGSPSAQLVPLPPLPAWQLTKDFVPKSVVKKGVLPNGHTSGAEAKVACEQAGKRLCSEREWRVACGGEKGWKFPYGEKYVWGKCNVFREAHPAMELHDNPSIGHTDPRLNLVTFKGKPLLRKTGDTPECASRWGDDAIYDMVGNLDEWQDDPEGTFAGGFFSRSSNVGCDWKATGHTFDYADYSTGVRCCADLPAPAGGPAGG
jgi:sulfatase modifying factor 1